MTLRDTDAYGVSSRANRRFRRVRRPTVAVAVGCLVVSLLIAGGLAANWMLETSRNHYGAANTAADLQADLADLNEANWETTKGGESASAAVTRSYELGGRISDQMSELVRSGFASGDVARFKLQVDALVVGSTRERVLALLNKTSGALAQAGDNELQFHALGADADRLVKELRDNADSAAVRVQRGILGLGAVLLALVAAFLGWEGRRHRRSARMEAEAVARVRFEAIVERGSELIVLTGLDGEITYVSPSLTNMLGYKQDQSGASKVVGLIHPDDEGEMAALFATARRVGQAGPANTRVRHADETWRTLEMSVVDLTSVPEVSALLWTSRDVTDRELAHAAMRDSEARLAEAQHLALLGSWAYEIATGVLTVSDELYNVIGVDPAVGIASFDRFMLLVHPDDHVRAASFLLRVREDFTPFADELRIVTPAGDERWLALRATPGLDAAGTLTEMRGTLQDITDRKASESQLVHLALHDMLTGLPNRSVFNDRLEHVLDQRDASVGIMLLDVDGFKAINDSLGHSAGDAYLVQLAERLTGAVRPSDTVARLGGDEFTVLVEGAGPSEATAAADRILNVLSVPFEIDGKKIAGQASIGISFGAAGDNVDELLRDADAAMYAAKRHGGNRYELFNADMHTEVIERLALECDLRTVELGSAMTLHYQPVIDLQGGRLSGFEALLRWDHPERGPVAPDEFIPIAEESGTIVRIGRWVVEEACRQARVWQLAYPEFADLMMNVNVSARQLSDCDIVGDVAHALAVSGLDPAFLTLEITETMLMMDEDEVSICLHRLKDLGIRISVDDFGTGYSSLGHLDRFPVDELKIDRSFVARLSSEGGDGAVAMAVIRLARGLHIDVVAEGIEDEEQLLQLRTAACDRGQGWYFWKALAPAAAEDLLARSTRLSLPDGPPRTLLVVDDDDGVRSSTSRMLVRAGYRVVQARNGREALELAATNRLDGVVLDIHLPDGNGVEVCRQLKSMYDDDLAVVHVSGSAVSVEDRVLGLDSGADGYLVKPVAPAELIATVQSVLRGRRLAQQVR